MLLRVGGISAMGEILIFYARQEERGRLAGKGGIRGASQTRRKRGERTFLVHIYGPFHPGDADLLRLAKRSADSFYSDGNWTRISNNEK